jgi:hypothetical protein
MPGQNYCQRMNHVKKKSKLFGYFDRFQDFKLYIDDVFTNYVCRNKTAKTNA